MEGFIGTEISVVELLLIASLVAIFARRIRLPYTVALVLAGLALTFQSQLHLELTPELVLALFLPPLVFEAAFHIQYRDLLKDLVPILGQAIPGVILSTLLVGAILALTGILSWPLALLFGALISATDPVAVVAAFRSLGAPKRLTLLLEGESLFNDGTAIVIFGIVLDLVRRGTFSWSEGLLDFAVVSVGGLLIGFGLGYVVARVIARIDDYLIEITLTTVLAYGSFLLAEDLHVSGVLAVVAAGLVNGNLGSQGMSPTTRIVLYNFWEYVAFLANSFIFLLIGMNVELSDLVEFLVPVLIAVVAVLASRAVTVYTVGSILRWMGRDITLSQLHVMVWGGLRGAVSLALVLGLPLGLAGRQQLLAMTFGVVLFTLLVQATTIGSLLRRLGFTQKPARTLAYQRLQAQLLAVRAAHHRLNQMHREGALVAVAWQTISVELEERETGLMAGIDQLLAEHPEFQAQITALAREDALQIEKATLTDLAREGVLEEEVLHELLADVDEALQG